MGNKRVAQKAKAQDATTTSTTGSAVELLKETAARIPRTVAKGQAITSGMGGKEKYSDSKTNKK